MDQAARAGSSDSIIVSGAGYCLQAQTGTASAKQALQLAANIWPDTDAMLDIRAWLKTPKNQKFMGVQDKLAVIAAGRALTNAGLMTNLDGTRTGVYLSVGYIPFERQEIEELTQNSRRENNFSMQRFSTDGMDAVNPLLTFRCLPNMPAFHVSVNYDITGPYYVTYPDGGQLYVAMEQAIQALLDHSVDVALLGGVADQENFLVQNQLNKLGIKTPHYNCAGFLVLQRKSSLMITANHTGLQLSNLEIRYQAQDLMAGIPVYKESIDINGAVAGIHETAYLGPASLTLMLAVMQQSAQSGEITHRIQTGSNIYATSQWLVTG